MIRLVATGLASITFLAMCSTSAGASSGVVPRQVVEAQAAKVLAAQTGQKPPNVKCPGDLPARVGAAINCTLTPHGSKVVYPVKVTLQSIRQGTAHFYVQVGQAKGAANKATFCADNAAIDRATAPAQTLGDLIPIFEANQSTLNEFQGTAPPKVVKQAGTLVHAARVAVTTGNAKAFGTRSIQKAEQQVALFCGQNADGSPIGSPSTSTTEA